MSIKQSPNNSQSAQIVPILKKGYKSLIENYRPNTNLYSITKVFEQLISNRLKDVETESGIDILGSRNMDLNKKGVRLNNTVRTNSCTR